MAVKLSLPLLLLLILSGCASAVILPPADLNILVPAGKEDALRAALAAYREGSELRLNVTALGDEFYTDRTAALLLAGSSEADLLLLPGGTLAYWMGYHALRPFAVFDDPAQQPWLAALQVGGEQAGLPTQPEIEVLWYRADLLESAGLGVPLTWADFRAAALALNDPPRLYGAALAGSSLDSGSEFAAVLAGFGGEAVGADYVVRLNGIAGQQALEFYAGLRSLDGVTAPGAAEATRAAALDVLARGEAALAIAPLSAGKRLRDCAASPKVCTEDGQPLLAWAWLPGLAQDEAAGSLSAWVIPLRAKHPQAAENFARWLCGEEGASVWASGGGTPANRSVLARLGAEGQALARVNRLMQPLPPAVNAEEIWQVLHDASHAAVAGLAAPDRALTTAAVELEVLLRKEGY